MASPSSSRPASAWASRQPHSRRRPDDLVAPSRILIVADEAQVGRWLQHRIDTLSLAGRIELEDCATFAQRLAGAGLAGIDLLVGALDFSASAAPSTQAFLDQALGVPGAPPLV